MKNLGRKQIQEISEVEAFNLIGQYSETKGYKPIYFKVLMPSPVIENGRFKEVNEYMHYIHLVKNDKLEISIFFDEFEIGSICMDEPYYEIWDGNDIDRFVKSEEDEFFKVIKNIL